MIGLFGCGQYAGSPHPHLIWTSEGEETASGLPFLPLQSESRRLTPSPARRAAGC